MGLASSSLGYKTVGYKTHSHYLYIPVDGQWRDVSPLLTALTNRHTNQVPIAHARDIVRYVFSPIGEDVFIGHGNEEVEKRAQKDYAAFRAELAGFDPEGTVEDPALAVFPTPGASSKVLDLRYMTNRHSVEMVAEDGGEQKQKGGDGSSSFFGFSKVQPKKNNVNTTNNDNQSLDGKGTFLSIQLYRDQDKPSQKTLRIKSGSSSIPAAGGASTRLANAHLWHADEFLSEYPFVKLDQDKDQFAVTILFGQRVKKERLEPNNYFLNLGSNYPDYRIPTIPFFIFVVDLNDHDSIELLKVWLHSHTDFVYSQSFFPLGEPTIHIFSISTNTDNNIMSTSEIESYCYEMGIPNPRNYIAIQRPTLDNIDHLCTIFEKIVLNFALSSFYPFKYQHLSNTTSAVSAERLIHSMSPAPNKMLTARPTNPLDFLNFFITLSHFSKSVLNYTNKQAKSLPSGSVLQPSHIQNVLDYYSGILRGVSTRITQLGINLHSQSLLPLAKSSIPSHIYHSLPYIPQFRNKSLLPAHFKSFKHALPPDFFQSSALFADLSEQTPQNTSFATLFHLLEIMMGSPGVLTSQFRYVIEVELVEAEKDADEANPQSTPNQPITSLDQNPTPVQPSQLQTQCSGNGSRRLITTNTQLDPKYTRPIVSYGNGSVSITVPYLGYRPSGFSQNNNTNDNNESIKADSRQSQHSPQNTKNRAQIYNQVITPDKISVTSNYLDGLRTESGISSTIPFSLSYGPHFLSALLSKRPCCSGNTGVMIRSDGGSGNNASCDGVGPDFKNSDGATNVAAVPTVPDNALIPPPTNPTPSATTDPTQLNSGSMDLAPLDYDQLRLRTVSIGSNGSTTDGRISVRSVEAPSPLLTPRTTTTTAMLPHPNQQSPQLSPLLSSSPRASASNPSPFSLAGGAGAGNLPSSQQQQPSPSPQPSPQPPRQMERKFSLRSSAKWLGNKLSPAPLPSNGTELILPTRDLDCPDAVVTTRPISHHVRNAPPYDTSFNDIIAQHYPDMIPASWCNDINSVDVEAVVSEEKSGGGDVSASLTPLQHSNHTNPRPTHVLRYTIRSYSANEILKDHSYSFSRRQRDFVAVAPLDPPKSKSFRNLLDNNALISSFSRSISTSTASAKELFDNDRELEKELEPVLERVEVLNRLKVPRTVRLEPPLHYNTQTTKGTHAKHDNSSHDDDYQTSNGGYDTSEPTFDPKTSNYFDSVLRSPSDTKSSPVLTSPNVTLSYTAPPDLGYNDAAADHFCPDQIPSRIKKIQDNRQYPSQLMVTVSNGVLTTKMVNTLPPRIMSAIPAQWINPSPFPAVAPLQAQQPQIPSHLLVQPLPAVQPLLPNQPIQPAAAGDDDDNAKSAPTPIIVATARQSSMMTNDDEAKRALSSSGFDSSLQSAPLLTTTNSTTAIATTTQNHNTLTTPPQPIDSITTALATKRQAHQFFLTPRIQFGGVRLYISHTNTRTMHLLRKQFSCKVLFLHQNRFIMTSTLPTPQQNIVWMLPAGVKPPVPKVELPVYALQFEDGEADVKSVLATASGSLEDIDIINLSHPVPDDLIKPRRYKVPVRNGSFIHLNNNDFLTQFNNFFQVEGVQLEHCPVPVHVIMVNHLLSSQVIGPREQHWLIDKEEEKKQEDVGGESDVQQTSADQNSNQAALVVGADNNDNQNKDPNQTDLAPSAQSSTSGYTTTLLPPTHLDSLDSQSALTRMSTATYRVKLDFDNTQKCQEAEVVHSFTPPASMPNSFLPPSQARPSNSFTHNAPKEVELPRYNEANFDQLVNDVVVKVFSSQSIPTQQLIAQWNFHYVHIDQLGALWHEIERFGVLNQVHETYSDIFKAAYQARL